jgi:hypothetical protein
MRMSMTFENGGGWDVGSAGYAFWVVRGDSALIDGGARDPSRWYVRRCIEIPQPATLASASTPKPVALPAPADSASSDAVLDLHGPLAILRMPNPARFAIELEFRVPGEGLADIDLFDVAGRRVLRREVDDRGAGVHRLFLADGNRVRPGVYWVRIAHGRQTVTRKVVLVP